MKISELMEKLGEIQGAHGDIEVCVVDDDVVYPVDSVRTDRFGRAAGFARWLGAKLDTPGEAELKCIIE